MKNWIKKYLQTWDLLMVVIGGVLMYFAEDIVLFWFPLDPMPSSILAFLMYFTLFTIAAFFLFNGVAYLTIKIYWPIVYDYIESQFKKDFAALTKPQLVCVSLGFFLSLLFMLVLIFHGAVSSL